MIGKMIAASRTLTDEFYLVPAMQELAAFIARNEALLLDDDLATLIGIGAVLIRESRAELSAQIQATMAIANARSAPPPASHIQE
jgi:hypothetical protein